ncbi:MAG TPA: GNAT family N-acetyltransferase [Patescibacteria group bacterium]|nr:GNAT family N-acetyltransferase [Patescibacteria group bacterium]
MNYIREEKTGSAVRISVQEAGQEVGRIHVFFITNDLHDRPYALLEDLFVAESQRNKGLGSQLVKEAVAVAKDRGCYKVIGTSRHSRETVHEFYQKLGFSNYGLEFRLDL